ncbi:MAG TPA: cation:dicarboxylase symporter family transporter [Syntrophorhabdaceae bacterium]|nr:cation:dicarboxylase symporter family transporter [Syntrophorhabdaceae bacterium]HQM82572.1 cation:dicarboxylase symporter family transporter [Syntrophorhabdaceae bacterium]
MGKKRKMSLTAWVFTGMILGLAVGWLLPGVGVKLEPLGIIFIRIIKTVIVPIIFATLVVGIAGHGDLKAVGRMGLKSIIYFEIVTTFALFLGLVMVNIMKPGVGMHLDATASVPGVTAKQHSLSDAIINIFPENFFDAAARGDVLEVVIFTILFAIALSLLKEKKKPIIDFCDALAETMFKYTGIVMNYAPIGVGAAIAFVVGSKGLSVLVNMGALILTLYVSLICFMILILLPAALIFRVPIRRFLSAVKEPAIIAFSTTSSEAALPKAMQAMEALGVPRRIVAFVIPTGYSFNLDGTTLYLSLASVFIAQASGIDLSISQQLLIGFTLIFASKGCAGVPRASLIVLAGTLASFGIPVGGIAVILGVDSIMDMARTTTNIIGNCLASVIIARWEGEFVDNKDSGQPSAIE